ncbi:MAG: S46 family peptidase [Bacteroidetes bacterium]|nr:S46 family peptidase [Bacteroidota bacterium]
MKKSILIFLSFNFLTFNLAKADEGMWLPMFLKAMNEADMQSKGLKLTAEDIYSINKSSLKDAIVHFGGGCTAEIISDKGLMFTNHHCGYGQIQSHSTVENDLLTNGFWAKSQDQELPNPGLTATIIIRMEDVTKKVLENVTPGMSDAERENKVNESIGKIINETVKDTHYGAYIRPFFYGNEYYMFVTETFKDVRLVGAPPSSIGKFGGDTDNWMWPRHTGDFSIFRIYANKDNRPAEYSKDNVPYKPKYVIPISIKGIEENDFTMVYGFPGRTSEYLSSYAVNIIMNEQDPAKVKIRATRLGVWDEDMKASDKVRIQYSAKYAGIANYWKKWDGEIKGLKKADAINKKKKFEQDFMVKVNADQDAKAKYGTLFTDLEKLYGEISPVSKQRDYYGEAVMGIEAVTVSSYFFEVINAMQTGKKAADLQKNIDKLKTDVPAFYKDYNAATDEKICVVMLEAYLNNIDKSQRPAVFAEIEKKYKGDLKKYAKDLYSKSMFVSQEKIMQALNDLDKNYKKIAKDPVFKLMHSSMTKYTTEILPKFMELDAKITSLNRTYMKAMRELITTKKYYPDANSTLRVTYGKVNGYEPKDGIHYNYYTTLDGVMEKENPAVDEFVVAPKLKDLYLKKDYGQYANKNGELPVAFCASNHTTGGNSGSPVFNGEGQLIGTNFDRNWEGTMSDIIYNPDQVRNIVLDVRFTLFVIDKFAGAGYLLNEMKIIK